MDYLFSEQKIDQSQGDKKKINDGFSVMAEQQQALENAKNTQIRTFRLETVTIDTLSGQPLLTKMWVTDEQLQTSQKKEKDGFKCEYCDKIFDKRQKMLLHSRFHNK